MKKIKKADIAKLLSSWQQEAAVYVPSRRGGPAEMAEWDGQDTAFLEWYRNTVVPPKAGILPNMEKLFGFHKDESGYIVEAPANRNKKQVIFGIRPCDARAITIIDKVFKDAYEDTYYLDRRRNTVLVGIGCTTPYDSCFCTSLGLGPAETADMDLMLTDIGEDYIIEEVTDKGKDLLAISGGLAEANDADEKKAGDAKDAAAAKVTRRIDTKEIARKLPTAFESEEYWGMVARKCVSCGICTFLCPTCYCFDINDEALRGDGARYRNWDCCSFPLYTKMPMENPREDKWRRVRQKVSHKYLFYPELFDIIACTGCGRCIRLCPVNWDITQTLSGLPGESSVQME